MTARRTNATRGWVNFPVDSLPSSNEGGMYVQLVVVPSVQAFDFTTDAWMLCCGSLPGVMLSEVLIHDGVHQTAEVPELPEGASPEVAKAWIEEMCAPSSPMAFHFPHYVSGGRETLDYDSIEYLAVITLGSTGWSNGEWRCTFADLTPDGKRLHAAMEQLYGERGQVYLMTWLDT